MRIISIKAASRAVPYEAPYLFNIKGTASITMDQDEWVQPETPEKQVLQCQLKPTFTKEGWLKTLSILHNDIVIWEHTYETYSQRDEPRAKWCLISAGAQLGDKLSEVCQLYHMPGDTTRRSRNQWIHTLHGQTMCFVRGIDDRSLVTMIEEGCIEHQDLKSVGIKRVEADSQWCEVSFE